MPVWIVSQNSANKSEGDENDGHSDSNDEDQDGDRRCKEDENDDEGEFLHTLVPRGAGETPLQ